MTDESLTESDSRMSTSSLTDMSTNPSSPVSDSPESEYSRLLANDSTVLEILNSDSSVNILFNRLNESLNTSEEFSKFIKKKAQIEDDHYNQLKRFAANSRTAMWNNSEKLKKDSLQLQIDKIIQFDETLHDVGRSYVTALNTMYDELTSFIETARKSGKFIREEYIKKEKECIDAISTADKARTKYNHSCEDLYRLKTSYPNKKSFSLNNKTIEQKEDEFRKKVEEADKEYKSKTQGCTKLKYEILIIHRPNKSEELKNLILESDIALNLQLQKYATWSEKLIMNSGVLISPLQSGKLSMKSMASSVDNEKDLYDYLLKHRNTPKNSLLVSIDYKIHPSLERSRGIDDYF